MKSIKIDRFISKINKKRDTSLLFNLMRKHFYTSPHKTVEIIVTFLFQGTTPEGGSGKIFKSIESTVERKCMQDSALKYAQFSSYIHPTFVVHDYLSDCHALLINIKSPQGNILWENELQEI